MDLSTIDLHPRTVSALRTGKSAHSNLTTAEEVLIESESQLAARLRISEPLSRDLLLSASRAYYPAECRVSTALALRTEQRARGRLTVGDPVLDRVLKGGVPTQGITEVYGRSGCGKTQMMLQICLTVQLPRELGGLDADAVYVATENFPNKRFMQLCAHFRSRFPALATHDPGTRVHVIKVSDPETQNHILAYQLPALASRRRIGLVVIDSIAAAFRGDDGGGNGSRVDGGDAAERARQLCEIGAGLKRMADAGVAVVIVNQVSDAFGDGGEDVRFVNGVAPVRVGAAPGYPAGMVGVGDGVGGIWRRPSVVPALGLAWSNQVNTRIVLDRSESVCLGGEDLVSGGGEEVSHSAAISRTLGVRFAPHLPLTFCNFNIVAGGIEGVAHDLSPM
ncbi:P-loop containing nucleoside triphosphate hydrolase protein [Blyttiomyces helicus]|uniref:P-loop containing nucleoside triphosphate hydrolase protein n=1 Tax=Blyttiomyces helicus TaxID=388810 RepID=A0A4P9WHU6_9FUNG|nr:P-loop containing nucleoside triphosphate hydrolase protein [Blyttiomyces helicus]|eukprot:RKO91008.1 P-loop containing nucleoside triphosphate hydrolase protein [Blyttiomyces helicus]